MNRIAIGLAAATLATVASPAFAHHSFAMFDQAKTITLDATVKEFVWSSPHCWIDITLTNPATGQAADWSIETGAPPMLMRTGWTYKTLQPGDKISLVVHPLRNGKPSASLIRVTLANGTVLGPGGAPKPLPLKAIPKS